MKIHADKKEDCSDQDLHHEMVSGNDSAFYILFERFWESTYSNVYKILKDEAQAKDVVQDIFINFWEKRHINEITNVGGYLYRAGKFGALKAMRDNKSHLHDDLESIEKTMISDPAGEDTEELQLQIDQSISELPEKCRQVFLLSREEQFSNREIAEKLGLSQRTVETHISNALKHLRKTLPKGLVIPLLMNLIS